MSRIESWMFPLRWRIERVCFMISPVICETTVAKFLEVIQHWGQRGTEFSYIKYVPLYIFAQIAYLFCFLFKILFILIFIFIYLVAPGLSCGSPAAQFWHANSQLQHACGIQFPDQGSNPAPLHWERRVLTTGPPGKSRLIVSFMRFLTVKYYLTRPTQAFQRRNLCPRSESQAGQILPVKAVFSPP